EHFSYFSLHAAEAALFRHRLVVFDVDEIPTHGGSLRLYVRHAGKTSSAGAGLVRARAAEHDAGMDRIEAYQGFAAAAAEVKRDLREFLIGVRRAGKRVAAYGAAAKGTILLNYC